MATSPTDRSDCFYVIDKRRLSVRFKQIGLGLQNYHQALLRFPPGQIWDDFKDPAFFGWSWGTYILPYIESGAVTDQIEWGKGFIDARNFALMGTTLEVTISGDSPTQDFALTK